MYFAGFLNKFFLPSLTSSVTGTCHKGIQSKSVLLPCQRFAFGSVKDFTSPKKDWNKTLAITAPTRGSITSGPSRVSRVTSTRMISVVLILIFFYSGIGHCVHSVWTQVLFKNVLFCRQFCQGRPDGVERHFWKVGISLYFFVFSCVFLLTKEAFHSLFDFMLVSFFFL